MGITAHIFRQPLLESIYSVDSVLMNCWHRENARNRLSNFLLLIFLEILSTFALHLDVSTPLFNRPPSTSHGSHGVYCPKQSRLKQFELCLIVFVSSCCEVIVVCITYSVVFWCESRFIHSYCGLNSTSKESATKAPTHLPKGEAAEFP